MLKIPKQIYFDQELLQLYTDFAKQEHKPFAAVVRETLAKEAPKVKGKLANSRKKLNFLDLLGSVKSPYKRRFTARQERQVFEKAMGEHAAREGLYG